MTFKSQHLSFVDNLRAGLLSLQIDLGADWPQFSQILLQYMDQFLRADNEWNRDSIFSDLLDHIHGVSHRSNYIAELMILEGEYRHYLRTKLRSEEALKSSKSPDPVMRGAIEPVDGTPVDPGLMKSSVQALEADIRSSTSNDDGKKKPRYFNAFFTHKETGQLIVDKPLLKRPYNLKVEISPEKRGPGEGDTFVDRAIEDAQKQGETIPLSVVASSRDFEIKPRIRNMELPPEGAVKEPATFSVKPLVADQRAVLQVEIFYRGHLLQAKRLEVFVLSDESSEIPVSLKPQSARITFTTTEHFSVDTLSLMPARVLSIDVERDPRDQSVDLRFLDRTNGEEELAFYDTTLEPQALGKAVSAVRDRLKVTVTGEERNDKKIRGYDKWIVRGSDAMLLDWLPYLANVGRSLYRALLPESQRKSLNDAGEKLQAALRPGATIQINPIAGRVTIPWSLLYERPVFINPSQNRICSKYWTEGPECSQCESQSNPAVICPSAFWGYRYAIEQLPCWVGNELPNPLRLLRRISNGNPLLLNLNVYPKFEFWKGHVEKLEAAGAIHTMKAEDLDTVANTWSSHSHELDILYFYTHGGTEQSEPYLEVSDGRITSNMLESTLRTGTLGHNPLVFLNGCSTGDYGPESFVSLIDDFRGAGACGVIGTECAVPELFAEAYATRLFSRLFRGERLGEAMLELRREFLNKEKNPLALVYSLYAANEISLASPVNKS